MSSTLSRLASDLGLSSEAIQASLRDPQLAEMMRRASMSDVGREWAPEETLTQDEMLTQEIMQLREQWKVEATLPPEKPVPTRRSDREYVNQRVINSMTKDSENFKYRVLKTFIGQDKHFSTTPIQELRPIGIRDMLVRRIHKGRYLLCRTFLKPVRMVAVELSIEDTNGDVLLLAVYNMPGLLQASLKAVDSYFPVGTVLAIREPWMKLAGGGRSGNTMIRVDSPSDVIIIHSSHSMLSGIKWKTQLPVSVVAARTGDQWKAIGDRYYKASTKEENLLVQAAIAWSQGLKEDPSMHVLYLNRAQAYLRLEWFSAALADALHVLSHPNSLPSMLLKARYRAACAEYGLERYAAALSRLEGLPGEPSSLEYKKRCRARMNENTTGQYSWIDMFRAGQVDVPALDVANYVAATIMVASIPNRGGGRGIKAVRDIKAGEFLVVAKPFASVFPAELDKKQVVFGLNFITNRADKTSSIALITRVVTKILGCPAEAELVYSLYAGPKFAHPSSAYPPPLPEHPVTVDPLHWTIDVDMAKIDGILCHNSFSLQPIKEVTQATLRSGAEDDHKETPAALYTFPSLFNHSCHPNAVWRCFGDAMVIRARQDIKCDSEVTLPYAWGHTYLDREKQLASLLDQPCDCEMCNADRADGENACRRRIELCEELKVAQLDNVRRFNSSIPVRASAEAYIRKILSTYPAQRKLPRPPLFNAYSVAMQSTERDANRQGNMDLLKKSIQHGWRALEEAGFTELDTRMTARHRNRRSLPLSKESLAGTSVDVDVCILLMVHISASFLQIREMVCSERWFRAAWWAHDASFGGGQALFDARLGSFLHETPKPLISDYGWD